MQDVEKRTIEQKWNFVRTYRFRFTDLRYDVVIINGKNAKSV